MKTLSISKLEKEIASVEIDAVSEEQNNADENYALLDNELEEINRQIPYPETKKYDVTSDYDERERIESEKNSNKIYWEQCERLEKYCSDGSLYCGHLKVNDKDYYIMDSPALNTRQIGKGNHEVWLLNADDRRCTNHIRFWRNPKRNANVQLSRNITMSSRKVSNVEVLLDEQSEFHSDITDAYLRKALIRHKNKPEIRSIIQTIQEKQYDIREIPKDDAFIVQGCAGSGKTMVLLHRLRYLLSNKDIYGDEYVFLVPGDSFKEFIGEISNKFNINKKNILTYSEFCQLLIGRKEEVKISENSELVFSSAYLERVYSSNFIKEIYHEIYKAMLSQTNRLIEFCEKKLNAMQQNEERTIKQEIENLQRKALARINEVAKAFLSFTTTELNDEFENILPLIEEIESEYSARKKEYDAVRSLDASITIAPDDLRLLRNESLLEIVENIEAEKRAIEEASVFTLLAHKNKLKKLEERYQDIYESVMEGLIKEEKRKIREKASELSTIYPGVNIEDVENVLKEMKEIYAESSRKMAIERTGIYEIAEYIKEQYSEEILNLTELIEFSGDMESEKNEYIEQLIPCFAFWGKGIKIGSILLESFKKSSDSEELEYINNEFSLFTSRTENQINAYLDLLFFNACKRRIHREFGIKIHQSYKHYWYLALYCKYLTRPPKRETKKYIFIDEAQDLSVSEIELIYKTNNAKERPVLNMFGDTNQTITTHGITDWSQIKLVPTIHILEENFRNTNQIVDYCNEKLEVAMKKVGVDMEEVSEFKNIQEAQKTKNGIPANSIFIVKDEYLKLDLVELLIKNEIEAYEIYTVKEAKGLEFKEVFVFDTHMSLNEKYISFTRALTKLNIIKELPETTSREKVVIIQGTDEEEVFE